jgi:glutathione S-transferase
LFEDHLYWVICYYRWIVPENFEQYAASMGLGTSFFSNWVIKPLAKRGVEKQIYAHGLGRHSEPEILQFAKQDIDAIAALMPTQEDKYLFGRDAPSTFDAVAYGFLVNVLHGPAFHDNLEYVKYAKEKYPHLQRYVDRIREKYWPEKYSQ